MTVRFDPFSDPRGTSDSAHPSFSRLNARLLASLSCFLSDQWYQPLSLSEWIAAFVLAYVEIGWYECISSTECDRNVDPRV
jgi:hypothetical protein